MHSMLRTLVQPQHQNYRRESKVCHCSTITITTAAILLTSSLEWPFPAVLTAVSEGIMCYLLCLIPKKNLVVWPNFNLRVVINPRVVTLLVESIFLPVSLTCWNLMWWRMVRWVFKSGHSGTWCCPGDPVFFLCCYNWRKLDKLPLFGNVSFPKLST